MSNIRAKALLHFCTQFTGNFGGYFCSCVFFSPPFYLIDILGRAYVTDHYVVRLSFCSSRNPITRAFQFGTQLEMGDGPPDSRNCGANVQNQTSSKWRLNRKWRRFTCIFVDMTLLRMFLVLRTIFWYFEDFLSNIWTIIWKNGSNFNILWFISHQGCFRLLIMIFPLKLTKFGFLNSDLHVRAFKGYFAHLTSSESYRAFQRCPGPGGVCEKRNDFYGLGERWGSVRRLLYDHQSPPHLLLSQ